MPCIFWSIELVHPRPRLLPPLVDGASLVLGAAVTHDHDRQADDYDSCGDQRPNKDIELP